jgi:hypothetical protein
MENIHKVDVSKFKADSTRADDTHRKMYNENQIVKPRTYDVIPTSNRMNYNFDTENRRDYGLETGLTRVIDLDLFMDKFKLIFAGVVHDVKARMIGEIDKSIWEEARKRQRGRVVQDDLVDLVAPIFIIAHIGVDTEVNAIDRMGNSSFKRISDVSALNTVLRKYRIAFKDDKDHDGKTIRRTYMVDPKGLAAFGYDMSKIYKGGKVSSTKVACETALLKSYIELDNGAQYIWKKSPPTRVPGLKEKCRPFILEITDADDIASVEQQAKDLIEEHEAYLPAAFPNVFL